MSTAGPYPYIYVNPDGTARELHANERVYLETPFKVGDGNTPYIKIDYDARDGWGEIRGYLGRSKLPQDIPIQPAPVEDPIRPMGSKEFAAWLRARSRAAKAIDAPFASPPGLTGWSILTRRPHGLPDHLRKTARRAFCPAMTKHFVFRTVTS